MPGLFTLRCAPDELREGLFGQVLLEVFETLPVLRALGIFPAWHIESALYGTVLPGVLDLAYAAPTSPVVLPFKTLHRWHCHVLGNDWVALARLWHAYFRVPPRVLARADALGAMERTLGVHYRGHDKLTTPWDTNAVSHDEMIVLVRDLLARRPELTRVFVATDDFSFVAKLQSAVSLPIANAGAVGFHKATETANRDKAERALLDCVLLSRCAAVLKTSSALSAFAKVLNPSLEIYRCSASKLFADIPYFPVAYVPVFAPSTLAAQAILSRTMRGDWTADPRAAKYRAPFRWRRRSPLRGRFGKALLRLLRVGP